MIGLIDPTYRGYRTALSDRRTHWAIREVVSSSSPTAEPLTLADLQTELRNPPDDEGNLIQSKIRAARITLEERCSVSFLRRQFDLLLDEPYGICDIRVPRSPLVSIDAVTGYGSTGNAIAVSSSAYTFDEISEPGRLLIQPGGGWPFNLRSRAGLVIRFTCGYADAPTDLQGFHDGFLEAMKQLVTFLYEHRGDGADQFAPPAIIDDLLSPYLLVEAG